MNGVLHLKTGRDTGLLVVDVFQVGTTRRIAADVHIVGARLLVVVAEVTTVGAAVFPLLFPQALR